MTLDKPCLTCGEPTPATYCPEHAAEQRTRRNALDRTGNRRDDTRQHWWRRLSQRARRLQPWCLLCHTNDNLQGDHSPRAWARMAAKLPVRLCDVNVLCGPCNLTAGSSQPDTPRFRRWQQLDGDPRATTPDPTLAVTLGGHPHPDPDAGSAAGLKVITYPRGYPVGGMTA